MTLPPPSVTIILGKDSALIDLGQRGLSVMISLISAMTFHLFDFDPDVEFPIYSSVSVFSGH